MLPSKVGLYDEKLLAGEDKDMWFRLSRCFSFEYLPRILVRNYLTPKSLSRGQNRDLASMQRLFRWYEKDYRGYSPERYAYLLCRLGKAFVKQKRSREGRACFAKAVEVLHEKGAQDAV